MLESLAGTAGGLVEADGVAGHHRLFLFEVGESRFHGFVAGLAIDGFAEIVLIADAIDRGRLRGGLRGGENCGDGSGAEPPAEIAAEFAAADLEEDAVDAEGDDERQQEGGIVSADVGEFTHRPLGTWRQSINSAKQP